MLAQRELKIEFKSDAALILQRDRVVANCTRIGGLYTLNTPKINTSSTSCLMSPTKQKTTCESCIMGKMPRVPIPKVSTTRARDLLELVHSDVAGPLPVTSRGGARAPSRENIKALRSDGGGEYTSTEFKDYLDKNGIAQQFTVAYTPQQNGVAERMNRTLKDLTRSMLVQKRT
eukprot:IDg5108t1